jgi:Serine carboxypeptidase S28
MAAGGIGSAGMQQLEKDFNTCSTITSELDLSVLLSDLMGDAQTIVQYNNPNAAMNVVTMCEAMTATPDAYGNFVALTAALRSDCEDASWDDSIAVLSDTAPNGNAMRSWTYQTCAQFGYAQTTTSPHQPFHSWAPLNLGLFREICRAAFDGWSVDPDTTWTNEQYGGTSIDATNILFGAGTVDPWHSLGITNETVLKSDRLISAFMVGTSHCRDLYAPSDSDPADVKAAHAKTAAALELWLS